MEIKTFTDEEIETMINLGPKFADYYDSVCKEIRRTCVGKKEKDYRERCIVAARMLINSPLIKELK